MEFFQFWPSENRAMTIDDEIARAHDVRPLFGCSRRWNG
jgi:hypothetical protein